MAFFCVSVLHYAAYSVRVTGGAIGLVQIRSTIKRRLLNMKKFNRWTMLEYAISIRMASLLHGVRPSECSDFFVFVKG